MKIQAFIPDWPGEKQHADALYSVMSPFCETTIIRTPRNFFTEQWNEARARFSGDVLLWVMADVWTEQYPTFFARCKQFMERGDIAVYTSKICFTNHRFDTARLPKVEDDVYEVPCTDMLNWALHRDLLDVLPVLDPDKSECGWGIDFLTTVLSRRLGKKVVRDYSVLFSHKDSTCYNKTRAMQEMEWLFSTLDKSTVEEVRAVIAEGERLRGRD